MVVDTPNSKQTMLVVMVMVVVSAVRASVSFVSLTLSAVENYNTLFDLPRRLGYTDVWMGITSPYRYVVQTRGMGAV